MSLTIIHSLQNGKVEVLIAIANRTTRFTEEYLDAGASEPVGPIGQEPYHFFLLLILFIAFTLLAVIVRLYSSSFKETSRYVSTALSY